MPKDTAVVESYEAKAKNILKAELKRRGITYGQLADRLTALGTPETERNIANKISRGSFTTAFFLMCMDAIGVQSLNLGS
ncbi:hypothetical protein DDZ14_14145 [Maritimibacter sp. 55A14]|uniref:DUF6471 domain-containing protein n=1 Tax=Maritimibacter sp. 55A14 TaxID=2174844 RepID=UPI000D61FA99|nr:DUF6471 domain-containing protein [Maritimibacter sp. 55A14]PWE31204.1 hypothetical protein DDZ14_14145 [Maritimibacter sp. 55A14]